jgi:hypothetical protein
MFTMHLLCISIVSLFIASQPDGQLLSAQLDADSSTYTDGNTIYWQQLHAIASAGAYLKINNDNSFGVYHDSSKCIWTSASQLSSGLHVTAPHSFYSASGAYELRLQVDGNLVAYDTASSYVVWQTGTSSTVAPTLHMTAQGNLVLTTAKTLDDSASTVAPLWQLNTHSDGAYMHIDDATAGIIGIYARHEPSNTASTKIAQPLVTAAYSVTDTVHNSRSYTSRKLAGVSNSGLKSTETISATDYDTNREYTFASPDGLTTLVVKENGFMNLYVSTSTDAVWTVSIPPVSNNKATATLEMNVS